MHPIKQFHDRHRNTPFEPELVSRVCRYFRQRVRRLHQRTAFQGEKTHPETPEDPVDLELEEWVQGFFSRSCSRSFQDSLFDYLERLDSCGCVEEMQAIVAYFDARLRFSEALTRSRADDMQGQMRRYLDHARLVSWRRQEPDT